MTRLAFCLLLLATGASAGQTFHVEAFGNIDRGGNCVHDEERGITCYVFYGGHFGGISCISDSQPQASNQRQCSGQLIPDTVLSFSSAFAGASPSLN